MKIYEYMGEDLRLWFIYGWICKFSNFSARKVIPLLGEMSPMFSTEDSEEQLYRALSSSAMVMLHKKGEGQ